MIDTETLSQWVADARRWTIELIDDLSDDRLMGARLDTVNPLLWEIGHLAWFQEKFVLRDVARRSPIIDNEDELWNSSTVAHDTRWDLPLLSRSETIAYMNEVRDRVIDEITRPGASDHLLYMTLFSVFHEDMHAEAIAYTRQTLSFPAPRWPRSVSREEPQTGGLQRTREDVKIPGGTLMLGAARDSGFVFDNEKWAHPVSVQPFAISSVAVTQGEFAEFVDDGGYERAELWSEEGRRWRAEEDARHPVYWRRENGGWARRVFDAWTPLEADLPMIHCNYYEADAFCTWAARRLPTEAEWEMVASLDPDTADAGTVEVKRRYPWGEEAPTRERANLDMSAMGCVSVDALASGDSGFGARQLFGNVWEWTESTFLPYPGFEVDPYEDNSRPWFGSRKVLRGGAWATRARMMRNTLRNYFTPDRRDVLAGFRTCAR